MWSLIKTVVVSVATLLLAVGLYVALTAGVTAVLDDVYYGYDAVNGANDTQAIVMIVLVWDRLFGPTARSMRKHQKMQKKRSEVNYA